MHLVKAVHSQPSWWLPSSSTSQSAPYCRPLGAGALEGLACLDNHLLGLDRSWGYLFELHPITGYQHILNPYLAYELRDTSALAVSSDSTGTWIWFARDRELFRLPSEQVKTVDHLNDYWVCNLPESVESLAITASGILVSCYQRSKIWHLDLESDTILAEFHAPGVGPEQIMVQGDVIWVSDRVEETIYVLSLATGAELARFLTPYPGPTGLTIWNHQLWVAYATEETYIHDSPNDPDPLSVAVRNKTMIAPLRIKSPDQGSVTLELSAAPSPAVEQNGSVAPACPILFLPQFIEQRAGYTLTNGYRVELTYLEEFDQEDPRSLSNLIWKIALPCHSRRQQVHSVESVGCPFTIEELQGQQVAVFQLGDVHQRESRLFGWKAVLDLYSIKYQIDPDDVEDAPIPEDLTTRYLVDDDYLSMNTSIVQEAARDAIGTETNILRKMAKIREYVYDQLAYRVTPRIEPPDVVLAQGSGSCGEYVGVLLALARLNGIACRTVGRYKCPPHPDLKQIPLLPEYNHVWIEFYLPGWGWVPMESNPDDLGEPPYPERYFMGLPWTHAEIAKGIPFETCNAVDVSIGQLAINHVQFRILEEL